MIGTLDMLMRSCVLLVKSVAPRMSELSVAPEQRRRWYRPLTFGNCLVSSSAVAVPLTLSMNRLLKSPIT